MNASKGKLGIFSPREGQLTACRRRNNDVITTTAQSDGNGL